MADKAKDLTPGGRARVFRDGGVLEGSVDIPERGPLEVRHLRPGTYELRDEAGGTATFEVSAREETTVAWRAPGKLRGSTHEPGSSRAQEVPVLNVGTPEDRGEREAVGEPTYPDSASVSKVARDPAADVVVPGEAGSVLVDEVAAPDPEERVPARVTHDARAAAELSKRGDARRKAQAKAKRQAAAQRRRKEQASSPAAGKRETRTVLGGAKGKADRKQAAAQSSSAKESERAPASDLKVNAAKAPAPKARAKRKK